eukprot:GILJ01004388.1.p1 GENE.GILJ01004388.1~~GILJ01004388.1.p1  ORF type:complete len:431 (+),score=49.02 GILJ01004388.1:136-1293(+)
MENLSKEFERVTKKQRTCYEQVDKTIDALSNEIARCKRLLEGRESAMETDGALSSGQLLSLLQSNVTKLQAQATVQAAHKDYHVGLSKYGKAIEKTLNADMTKSFKPVQFDKHTLNEELLQHFLRHGHVEVGQQFAKESRLPLPEGQDAFKEMHKVLDSMTRHDLLPALQWVKSNATSLSAKKSPLPFQLHRLQFIHLLTTQPQEVALAYAREQFEPFSTTNLTEIQRLMGSLLFVNRLSTSPYADLVDARLWTDAIEMFTKECCRLLGLSFSSPLEVTVNAGAKALPTLYKLSTVMQGKKDWFSQEQMPVELELGREFQFHSIFACPVSREQSTSNNPPMILPCGHVLAKLSLLKISRNNLRLRFKCPTCPSEQTASQARQIFF